MWEAIALSFGLAMDAAAVSAARGLGGRTRELVILPLAFGGAQSAMSALGWALGAWGDEYIARFDFWIAFALLTILGGKMILEAVRGGDDDEGDDGKTGVMVYVGLAIATSIDAAAAGLTLPLVPVAPWISLVLIGAITAGCSALAFALGRSVGAKLGKKLEILGGVVLIAIGVRMLLPHVSF